MLTDDELIEEILNGSQAAMEVLVKRYYNAIFSYIYRTVGDYQLSYDLTQEIFIKMMKNIKNYRRHNQFSHWLFKIAANHCRDYYRSSYFKNIRKTVTLDEMFLENNDRVVDLLEMGYQFDEVKEAILTLPEEQREVIILRFYHNMKIKEIAEVTASKEATVKSRLMQGLLKLRNLLDECYAVGGVKHEKNKTN